MSPSARGLAALLCSAALFGGCKKEEEPAPFEDRTLAKLRQEVDRVNKGGAPSAPPSSSEGDPNARLADLAAGHEADTARTLTPPGANDTVHVDTFALKLTGLESLHSLRGTGKVSLTTQDLFLRAQLIAQNVGPQSASLALSGAKLVDAADKEYPLAQDAQTLAGTRKLDRTWDKDQRDTLVLLFEVPPSAIAPGLTLVLPTSGTEPVRIPLQ
ncbi:MAG TPA: hypothetical protein VF794_40150 [Archangium sp.]|jgi:hypothetical protein|uniref:hypothetical protein n=1 Tax=Archangium sp. TaxID=1872627 RepID=UPI002ED85BF2